jgi:hypothetical protein
MSTNGSGPHPRRHALKAAFALLVGTLFARPATSEPVNDDYDQPKLDRELVKYRDAPGPDGHFCSNCTNYIAPSSCRVVAGEISPGGYCLSYAPKDVDFK